MCKKSYKESYYLVYDNLDLEISSKMLINLLIIYY